MRIHHEPQYWELQIGRLIIAYKYVHWRNTLNVLGGPSTATRTDREGATK